MKGQRGNPNIGHTAKTRLTNGVNAALPGAFEGATDTHLVLGRERPVHRRIAMLATEGYTNKEIASAVGYTPSYVSHVLRQPFAQSAMISNVAKDTATAMKEALEKAAPGVLARLLNLAEDETLRAKDPKTFASVNQGLLDRFMGKASQPLEHHHTVNPNQLTDEELESIAAGGSPPPSGP